MVNKKMFAILVVVSTVFSASARFCYENGKRVACTGKVVGGAAKTAGNILTFGGISRAERRQQAARKEEDEETEDAEASRQEDPSDSDIDN